MEIRYQADKTPLNWAREGYVAKRGHTTLNVSR